MENGVVIEGVQYVDLFDIINKLLRSNLKDESKALLLDLKAELESEGE